MESPNKQEYLNKLLRLKELQDMKAAKSAPQQRPGHDTMRDPLIEGELEAVPAGIDAGLVDAALGATGTLLTPSFIEAAPAPETRLQTAVRVVRGEPKPVAGEKSVNPYAQESTADLVKKAIMEARRKRSI